MDFRSAIVSQFVINMGICKKLWKKMMIFWHEIVKKLLFRVTHGTLNTKKRILRSKIMKNRSTNNFSDLVLSHTKSSHLIRHVHEVDGEGLHWMFAVYGDNRNSCPSMHISTLEVFYTKIKVESHWNWVKISFFGWVTEHLVWTLVHFLKKIVEITDISSDFSSCNYNNFWSGIPFDTN